MQFKALLSQAMNAPLSYEQATAVFGQMMRAELSPVQISALLSVLATRGEHVDEYAAAVSVMRDHAVTITAPDGAMDIVGTGGDGKSTLNISTATAFVVAGAGVCVAKHGNKAVSSLSGAADVLSASGINVMVDPENAARILRDVGLMFLMAPIYHPAMKHVAPVRAEMGIRTLFNILGPMANPAGVRYQLTGAFSQDLLMPMAQTLQRLGTKRAWLVHDTAHGTDEVSITGETHCVVLEGDTLTRTTLHPEMAGLPVHAFRDLVGGTPKDNAKALQAVLQGEAGAYADAVLLNTASALMVAGQATDLPDGVAQARASIASGTAWSVFEKLKEKTRSCASNQ